MTHIRSATEKDIVHFKKVIESSILVLCKNYYTDEQINALLKQYPAPELYKKWIFERILIVAENGDKIVGFTQFDPAISSIEALHVLPEFTNFGIGRRLVEEVEKMAEKMDIKRIFLESSVNADKFYTQCGYTRKGPGMTKCNSGVELETIAYEKDL